MYLFGLLDHCDVAVSGVGLEDWEDQLPHFGIATG